MAHFSRLILIPLLLFISNSAFAEFDEIYWELDGNKFPTPQAAAENYISVMNFKYGNCQTQPISAARWQLNNIDVVQDLTANIQFKICSYSQCNLNCSNSSLDNKQAFRHGVCKPGRVYNYYTYQCQDECQPSEWQNVGSRQGVNWTILGIYDCSNGCLVNYDVYTDFASSSTVLRSKRTGGICAPDYCFGSQQLSSKCGFTWSCPQGFIISADGACVSEPPKCPDYQHADDQGNCVDNDCPAGYAKNLNGECSTDSDNDGKPDDSDGDGTPDTSDSDDDNDGTPDVSDPDSDGDGNPDASCPSGQVKDANGNCGFPNYDQCPTGTVKDIYGNCVPDSDNPDNPQQCPAGQVKDANGNCVTDNPDNPDNPQQCPAGQVKDANGNCVTSGSGDNGGGSGSGSGSASSSANCETAPQCQGDPIQCAVLKQAWETGCMLAQKNPDEDQQEKVEFTEIEVSNSINSGILGGGGGSCPADRVIALSGGKQIPISFSAVCQFASLIRAIILLLAGIAAIRIVMGVNVKGA